MSTTELEQRLVELESRLAFQELALQEISDALADARRQTVSTLLDIKVLPKTMVHKYLSWWRVGGAQVADSEKIVAVARKLQENIDKARDY